MNRSKKLLCRILISKEAYAMILTQSAVFKELNISLKCYELLKKERERSLQYLRTQINAQKEIIQ